MALLRAKTLDLKETRPLSVKRKQNSEQNEREALAGDVVLKSYPRRLVLEMTSACNINCKMCGRNAADFKATIFHKGWLKKFEAITDYVEEVTLLGWGEPTLHPQFSEFLAWGEEKGLRKFFCTNGTRLDVLKDDIFKYHVDLLTMSLDGATAGVNNSIRIGADFDRITDNLKAIVEEKKKQGLTLPYMSIVMTLMKSNYRQFPDYVRLAHELGLEECKGVYLTVFEEKMKAESMYNKMVELEKIFSEAVSIGEELGVNVKLPYLQGEDIAGNLAHKNCYVGWRDFFLGSDGYIRSCMSTSKKLFHIDKYETFDEMWNSVELQEFRKRVNSDEMDAPCARCYQASYANWNRKNSFEQMGNDFAPTWEK